MNKQILTPKQVIYDFAAYNESTGKKLCIEAKRLIYSGVFAGYTYPKTIITIATKARKGRTRTNDNT